MHCKQAQELFSDHLAGQLDPALNVSLENHERSCAACRAELAGLRRVWSELDALPSVEPPPFLHDNLMHRIGIEQEKMAETQRRNGWNWRALFQPRSPVFAAAMLLLLAMLGMGGLHVQHASLDPLGALWHLVSPKSTTSSAITARAEWHPSPQGGGSLTLYVQAQPGTVASIHALNYSAGGSKHVVPEGDTAIPSDHETTLTIPMESRPASDLTLTVTPPDNSTMRVPVSLMEPVSAPTDSH